MWPWKKRIAQEPFEGRLSCGWVLAGSLGRVQIAAQAESCYPAPVWIALAVMWSSVRALTHLFAGCPGEQTVALGTDPGLRQRGCMKGGLPIGPPAPLYGPPVALGTGAPCLRQLA